MTHDGHPTFSRLTLAILASVLAGVFGAPATPAADRSGICPGWLPDGEISAFYPDDGFTLHAPGHRAAYFRKTFDLPASPQRAALAVTGWHTVSVWLNGELVVEYYGASTDRPPRFVEVTTQLRPGRNELDVRAWSRWAPTFYLQLRIEQDVGAFVDVVSDASWEWCAAPADGWPRGAAPAAGWEPAEVMDDYYGSRGKASNWSKEFALMPRDLLSERMSAYSGRLRELWADGPREPNSTFRAQYVSREYEPQYRQTLRLDPDTGQCVDATGKVRHLFFTVYAQKLDGQNVLNWLEFDYDRLEHDLALMETGGVHPYVRFLGWHRLLDAEGNWRPCEEQPQGAGLPTFSYNYEVLDYLLDRCQAHGRFVVVECDFHWAAHWDTLPTPYHTRYYLYPEVIEASALAHRRILSRYAERACIAGFLLGEEEIQMAPDLENPHLRQQYTAYLRERYGTLGRLAQTWRRGYDFDDRSRWRVATRRATGWATAAQENPEEDVLLPDHPLVADRWARLTDWPQVGLPVWPRFRWPESPHAELMSHRAFLGDAIHTQDDPSWIDYNAFREDVLYLRMVSRWVEIVRAAVPRHWLFHSNAQDYTAHWHFIHVQRRAELPFPVIGVGSHDSGKNLAQIAPWHRVRKYIRVIASYRPYVLAPGSPAVAVSSGEGEGGNDGNEHQVLNYYRGQSLEMVGHGAAFELSYAWPHVSGADVDPAGQAKLTAALQWMGDFYRAVDGVTFSLRRDVPILVVRNNNLQRSNRSGRDFGNALGLLSFLAQLNLEFDVAMDQDLANGSRDRKVDLGQYRMVFLPCLECDYPEPVWQALDAWLSDPAHRGQRSLVIGAVGKRTPYLAPTGQFHPTLARWLGTADYAGTALLRGSNEFTWERQSRASDRTPIMIDFGERGDITPTGLFDVGRSVLTLPAGRAVGIATDYAGNAVYAFGFPLGLAFDNLWGLPYGLANGRPAPQEPYDVMAALYEDLIEAAGVPRPVRAPHNVRVAVSDDKSALLVREWFGLETTDLCTLDLPAGASYSGCELVPQADGRTLVRAALPSFGGLCFRRNE